MAPHVPLRRGAYPIVPVIVEAMNWMPQIRNALPHEFQEFRTAFGAGSALFGVVWVV